MTSVLALILALRCASPITDLRATAIRLSELKVSAFREAQQHTPPSPGGARAFGSVADDFGFAEAYYYAIADQERAAWQAVTNAEAEPKPATHDTW